MIIFGASGDLAKRKLIPALYELYKGGHLPDQFAVLGVSRSEYSDEAFQKMVFTDSEFIKEDKDTDFAKLLHYQATEDMSSESYQKVRERLEKLSEEHGTDKNYCFYLSVPPSLYQKIPAALSEQGLNEEKDGWRRLIVEKPFGYDAESAHELNEQLRECFEERQIFRIDHYLGKETVQNLLVTRFANGIFEPLWNRNYIHRVEITASEQIGVGSRGGYYDGSGAMRDMVQNHLMQVVAHLAMEPPNTVSADDIRQEKQKLFEALRPIPVDQIEDYVVRGQYTASTIDGEQVPGYRDAEDVPEDSKTETFVAMKFFIDNWRWADVPFYVRTGKRLPNKATEAVVYFNTPPHHLFRDEERVRDMNNQLIIRFQPDEGFLLQFGMKVPGAGFKVKDVIMDFHYSDLVDTEVPEAYERLLLDVMKGDATLYAHGDSVEAAWEFIDPILKAWEGDDNVALHGYPAGTWGPEAARKLMEHPSDNWRNPCGPLTKEEGFCTL